MFKLSLYFRTKERLIKLSCQCVSVCPFLPFWANYFRTNWIDFFLTEL
jgi:hypothetical protein